MPYPKASLLLPLPLSIPHTPQTPIDLDINKDAIRHAVDEQHKQDTYRKANRGKPGPKAHKPKRILYKRAKAKRKD